VQKKLGEVLNGRKIMEFH